jgi:hypothetical protein
MVVILSLALSVSFILKYGTKIQPEGFQEGVETMDASGNMIDTSGNITTTDKKIHPEGTDKKKHPEGFEEGATSTDISGNISGNKNPTPTLSPEDSANLLKYLTNSLNQKST